MSMIGNFLLVSDDEISTLLAAPDTIHAFLEAREDDDAHLDVDKAWHAIHFFLTGTAFAGEPPLDFVAAGGEPVGDEDVGYGPVRALRAEDVAKLHRALDGLPPERLADRYDGAAMDAESIYPGAGSWSELDPRSEDFEYYASYYADVRGLVARAATERRGLLVWLN